MSITRLVPIAESKDLRFPVAEIFGPTIQGEGKTIGSPCYFIRFGGCDYKCVWCDSIHAVDPNEVRKLPRLTSEEIIQQLHLLKRGARWVVLSGGNPLLHDLTPLVSTLKSWAYQISVETQGTISKEWMYKCDLITVSPKPPSSGMKTDIDALRKFLSVCSPNKTQIKMVVFNDEDFEYAKEMFYQVSKVIEAPKYLSVGNDIQAGDNTETLLKRLDWLVGKALTTPILHDVYVLPQLHVLLWGNKKGV